MAKIFISYNGMYSDYLYQTLEQVLLKEGNDVIIVNWANRSIRVHNYVKDISKENLTQKIIEFSPDLVFNFNTSCPKEIIQILECPIYIFEADMPYLEEYVSGQKYLKGILENENIYYIGTDSASKEILDKYLGYTLPEKRYLFLALASGLQKVDLPYKRNIFFCGSNWSACLPEIPNVKTISDQLYDLYLLCQNTKKMIDFINKYPENTLFLICIYFYFSGQERLNYMNQLVDLGLEVYGQDWESVGWLYNMELAQICHNKRIMDVSISDYYNSSKISVNFSHPQAVNSFSFRVMDIMASSSCILTEDKKDFHCLFDKYISKEVQEVILYKDRFDMREKAIRLLNDEPLRQRCVAECNYAIEQNGRWIHRLKEFQDFIDIPILGVGEPKSEGIEYLYLDGQPVTKTSFLHSTKRRIKNILICLLLIVRNIPIVFKILPDSLKVDLNNCFTYISIYNSISNLIKDYKNEEIDND